MPQKHKVTVPDSALGMEMNTQSARLVRRSSSPSLPDRWTHCLLSAPGDRQRRPMTQQRGNQELSPGRGRTPQPGLRLVHHTRQDLKQRTRAAEQFAITSSRP